MKKTSRMNLLLLLFVTLSLLMLPVWAADNALERPKIGLVLGGGGAAGVAHVGVIKVLEAQGVPIDMIAGTSMGAIVGSLYAAGYSTTEMEEIVKTLDWKGMFRDGSARTEQSFQQKRENDGFFNTFEVGVEGRGIKLPEGLISGQSLIFELRRLLSPVAEVRNFDRLPIPFRAVATDIETGAAVVLDRGNLATAVRASMSIPGLFAPVTIDNRLLVDGFVSNNVPVEVARSMGADIVIVVSIPYYFEKRNKLNSALAVSVQAMRFLTAKNSLPQLQGLRAPNVVIEPDVKDIGSLDFDRVKDTIPIGEAAARQHLAALNKLARLAGAQQPARLRGKAARMARLKNIRGKISRLILENDSNLENEVILSRLGFKEGDTLDLVALQRSLDNVYSLGYFDLVDYELNPDGQGAYTLKIMARNRSTGDNRLRFGFSVKDDLNGDTRYQLGTKYIRKGVTQNAGEWRNSLVLGDNVYFGTELYQPIGSDLRHFVNARAWHERRDVIEYDGDQRNAEVRLADTGVQVDWGRDIQQNGEWRTGLFYRFLKPDTKTGQLSNVPEEPFELTGLQLTYNLDTLDDVDFPGQGSWLKASYTKGFEILGADLDFQRFKIEGGKAWLKDKHRVLARAELGSTFSNRAFGLEQFTLGGHGRMSGLAENQLRGNHLLMAGGTYLYELTQLPGSAKAYAGASLEVGNTWQKAKAISWGELLWGSSLFVGIDSRIGPAFIGIGKTEGHQASFFMQIGRDF